MYVILSYDINTQRVGKVLKICRKYLSHVHRSVFEGYITEAKLNSLKRELKNTIDFDEDSICIFGADNFKNISKEQIGVVEINSNII